MVHRWVVVTGGPARPGRDPVESPQCGAGYTGAAGSRRSAVIDAVPPPCQRGTFGGQGRVVGFAYALSGQRRADDVERRVGAAAGLVDRSNAAGACQCLTADVRGGMQGCGQHPVARGRCRADWPAG
ncbi:hypothetical protein G6F57_020805 [Rhizopus arrhizus]|nr:hypothetical protein G6F57_020805 [Rhizopus arrhizus]